MSDKASSRLAETLDYVAATIPFYRSQFGALTSRAQLSDFPIINSDLLSERVHDFYNLTSVPDFIVTTGGTTGGLPKFIPLDYSELNALFFSRLGLPPRSSQAVDIRFDAASFPGLAVILSDSQHGIIMPPGHGRPVVALPLEVGRHLPLVVRILMEGLVVSGRRIPVIQLFGSATKLRLLTDYCEAQSLSSEQFSLERIISFAFYTSRRATRRLAQFWDADVQEAYGLTEFIGAVMPRCKKCGGYHPPETVHAEILHKDRDNAISRGAGRLVLTTLLPYRTSMPLVRYATGDIVQVHEPCPADHREGFVLLGREGTVLFDPADPSLVLLSPFDVVDAIEAIDDELGGVVAYDDQVRTVMSWGVPPPMPDFSRSGYPQVNCRVSDGRMLIVFETKFGKDTRSGLASRLLAQRLGELVAKRLSQSLPDENLVDIAAVPLGGISGAGLRVTLI